MATHRISLLNGALRPTGTVHPMQFAVHATNDAWDPLLWIFPETATRQGLYGIISIPQNYVGSAGIIVVWTTASTSGDAEFDFDYRAVGGNDTESLDQAGTQESVNANDTAPSAAFERMEIELPLTSANLAAGDTFEFFFVRDGTDAGDTLADEVVLFDLLLEYDDA